jgi:hypothetical protein
MRISEVVEKWGGEEAGRRGGGPSGAREKRILGFPWSQAYQNQSRAQSFKEAQSKSTTKQLAVTGEIQTYFSKKLIEGPEVWLE